MFFAIISGLDCSLLSNLFYVNIPNRSRDVECIGIFRSAMPRGADVVNIYVPRLSLLHLLPVDDSQLSTK